MNKQVKEVTFETLDDHMPQEGLVFIGAGGDLKEWIIGITRILSDEGILEGDGAETWYSFLAVNPKSKNSICMLVMPLVDLKVSRLAIWRLKFGDCCWWSDYKVNYNDWH